MARSTTGRAAASKETPPAAKTGKAATDAKKKAVGKTAATGWSRDPLTLGAFAAATPGGQPGRKVLMEPVRDRLFFAGEATSPDFFTTAHGAHDSGERAAREVMGLTKA